MEAPATLGALPGFQADAVRKALRIVNRYGGVLIADPTGAGKTFIGVALIEALLDRGLQPVLVTAPAGLRAQWQRPLCRLSARTCAARPGPGPSFDPFEADSAPAAAGRPGQPVVGWVSHTALSLGRWPPRLQSPALVLVDEAHAFRNPRTRRYRALARLCASARVVLLTATPVHNSLLDLYFQLRLFLTDESLEHLGLPDLRLAFLRAVAAPGPMSLSLRSGIDRVSIRRSRKDIERAIRAAGADEGTSASVASLRYPVRERPRTVAWRRAPPGFAPDCAALESLELAPFALSGTGASGKELMRFHLLKRLESSQAAFRDSVTRLTRFFESFLDALAQGFLLRPDDRRALARGASDAQLFLAPLALGPVPRGQDPEHLSRSVAADLRALKTLAAGWGTDTSDPKVRALDRLLAGPLAGGPVLVFTEFRVTAVELWRRLGPRLRCGLIHGGGAWIGQSRVPRAHVVRAFAPVANRSRVAEAERVRVLIATDVLSEGWNLQDARDVVSFDLPWNPVRLVQRLGRIDRLGSPHTTVRCHNFMPDRDLDDILRLVERLGAKLEAIRAATGERPRILGDAPPRHESDDARSAPATRMAGPSRAADRLRSRLLRLLAREPGGAGAALCERVDRVLDFLDRSQRIGVEFQLDALEREARRAPGLSGMLDRLEALIRDGNSGRNANPAVVESRPEVS